MPGARTDKRANITMVTTAAVEAGFTVSEVKRRGSRICLDITTDPSVFQFEAYFKETSKGFWGWDIGYHHVAGNAVKIYSIRSLIAELSGASS
jgi:hypothetical protein